MPDLSRSVLLDRSTPPTVATLIVLASVQAMAMNMFLPSLPAMAAHFNTDYATIQLSVALFLATNAVVQLLIGPMSDRFGRKPVLLGGFVIFLIATLGCIHAPSVEVFLGFRRLQSAVVVGMVFTRAMVRDIYDQDKAASMMGYITMGMSVVPMLTPALGGWLDEHYGWQANFWTFFGAAIFLMVLTWADVGETNTHRSSSFSQQFRNYPKLFRSVRFWGYAATTALTSGAFFAYLGGAPFVGTNVFGMTPSELGLLFGAPAIGYFVGNGLSGRFANQVGINKMVLMGGITASLGVGTSLALFYAGHGTPFSFFGLMTVLGLGNGLVIPNATAGMLSVRPELAGTASGLGGSLMIGGGAGLSALAGSMLSPQTGAFPLLWIMLTVTVGGVVAILMVIRREKRQGIA